MPKPAAVVATGWEPKLGVIVVVGVEGMKLGSALVAEGAKLGSALVAVEVKLGGAPGGALVAEVPNINGLGAEPAEDCPNLKAPESAVVGAFDVSADLNRFTFGGADGFVGGTDESAMTQNQKNTKL